MKQLTRNLSIILLTLLFATSCGPEELTEKFSYSDFPSPGDDVTIKYNPASTPLEGLTKVEMIVYLYEVEIEKTVSVEMEKYGNGWIGEFETDESTRGALIKFMSDKLEDINNNRGYSVKLFENENEVPGAVGGLASSFGRWGSSVGFERDFAVSVKLFEKEFEKNPQIKNEYIDNYFYVLNRVKDEGYENKIETELNSLAVQENLSEEDYKTLCNWFRVINKSEKADEFKISAEEKFPGGDFVQFELARDFRNESEVEKQIELLKEFEADYPASEYLADMYETVTVKLRNEKKYETAKSFMSDNFDKIDTYWFYSVPSRIYDEEGDLDVALEIVKKGVIKGQQQYNKPTTPKPKTQTEKEWNEERGFYLGMNDFIYAKILRKMGKKEEILPILEEAVELTIDFYAQQELNDLYAEVLVESGNNQKALVELSDMVQKGFASQTINGLLKTAYENDKGGLEGYDKFISQFESAAKAEMISKLKREMMNEPAPEFTLTDLDGKEISLSGLKGKIVVVDFWATWCGPCRQSFAGMKKAVEKYKEDESVKFLFVNTWERVDDKKKNARDFITKNDYLFHVLLDLDNKVISSYKVSGIPTKFIIDPSGNIRFRSVGYSGNPDQLVQELDAMFGLIKE